MIARYKTKYKLQKSNWVIKKCVLFDNFNLAYSKDKKAS